MGVWQKNAPLLLFFWRMIAACFRLTRTPKVSALNWVNILVADVDGSGQFPAVNCPDTCEYASTVLDPGKTIY